MGSFDRFLRRIDSRGCRFTGPQPGSGLLIYGVNNESIVFSGVVSANAGTLVLLCF